MDSSKKNRSIGSTGSWLRMALLGCHGWKVFGLLLLTVSLGDGMILLCTEQHVCRRNISRKHNQSTNHEQIIAATKDKSA